MASPVCQVTAVYMFLVNAPEIAFEMPSEIMDRSGQHKEMSAVLGQVHCGWVWVKDVAERLLSGSIKMTVPLMFGTRSTFNFPEK